MGPVDSIRPPKRAKKIKASAIAPPVSVIKKVTEPPPAARVPPTETARKQKTIILSVVVIMVLMFIAWAGLLASGKLTGSSGSSGFGATLSNQLHNLWQTVKTDILKIKNTNLNANSNVNDEQINKLENSVFPQFNDPTRQ